MGIVETKKTDTAFDMDFFGVFLRIFKHPLY